jgi:hypothetical protein
MKEYLIKYSDREDGRPKTPKPKIDPKPVRQQNGATIPPKR